MLGGVLHKRSGDTDLAQAALRVFEILTKRFCSMLCAHILVSIYAASSTPYTRFDSRGFVGKLRRIGGGGLAVAAGDKILQRCLQCVGRVNVYKDDDAVPR